MYYVIEKKAFLKFHFLHFPYVAAKKKIGILVHNVIFYVNLKSLYNYILTGVVHFENMLRALNNKITKKSKYFCPKSVKPRCIKFSKFNFYAGYVHLSNRSNMKHTQRLRALKHFFTPPPPVSQK